MSTPEPPPQPAHQPTPPPQRPPGVPASGVSPYAAAQPPPGAQGFPDRPDRPDRAGHGGPAPGGGKLREFAEGARLLARGLGLILRSPKRLVLGVIPALVSFVLFGAVFGVLAYWTPDLVTWATPFAEGWGQPWRTGLRVVAGIALLGAALLLVMLTYTAVTLLIGDPFYETISGDIEKRLGGITHEVHTPWWKSLGHSVRDSLRMILLSALIGIPLFVCGFIPIVGQTVIPVLGALVAGWFLALEVTGVSFQARGLRLADRRRVLKQHRPLALGVGATTFVTFLIPLGAVIMMPAAVAGGTLLARRVLGEPDTTDRHPRQGGVSVAGGPH